MELVLSAIAAGGLVGASDQYLCLLIISIAAKAGIITLANPMTFMASYWFTIITAIFWIITIAPSYATLFSPGVMHVINTIANTLSGFIVPFSAAAIALASAGIIANLNPELHSLLDTLKIFTVEGKIGVTGIVISGTSAVASASLTAMRAAAKPVVSLSTGTTGTISAPVYTTIENLSSILLMGLAYALTRINPWLLVGLFGASALVVIGFVALGIYQMWHLKRGIGRVLELTQTNPRAGLAIIVEFFVWGVGWFAWNIWGRGTVMLLAWVIAITLIIAVQPITIAAGAFFPPLLPFCILIIIILYSAIGLSSSSALLFHLEKKEK
jgi:hypothetical protein